MHDAWYKTIDFFQSNFLIGTTSFAVSFAILILLVVIIPSKKKKAKKIISQNATQNNSDVSARAAERVPQRSRDEGEKDARNSQGEQINEQILADYEATLNSKEREIQEKSALIEELDRKLQNLSEDVNVLENIPEDIAFRIKTTKKNFSYKMFFWGLLLGIILSGAIVAAYYIFVIKGIKI
ncbi:MAG: hypothetical protein OHK0038_09290 [Flammeovirgaceae bacterium]